MKQAITFFKENGLFPHVISEGIELETWKDMRRADSYLKVIIYGNKHLYYAHPTYQHRDYNKSIFGLNTTKNVERAKIVNRFLCSLPENRDILERDCDLIVKQFC